MSIKKSFKILFSLLVINTFAFGATSKEKVEILRTNKVVLKAAQADSYENKQVYYNDQNEKRTIYWTKGIEAPKMASDTEISQNKDGFFRKRTFKEIDGDYAFYYYPMEDNKGYYDFNKNPNSTPQFPQQVAHHCFLSTALNLIYWWFDQNSSYIDTYVSLLEHGYFPQSPELHPIDDPTMWEKYRKRPVLEQVSIDPAYKSMDLSNNILYREVFRSFQYRDEGYWPDLVWDSFFNGFEPDKPIREPLHMPKKDGGFFYPLLGKTPITKSQGAGSYEHFSEVLLENIIAGNGIGLSYQSVGPAHAITLWGAEYDESNKLKRVFYTDSDDFDGENDVYEGVLKGLYSNEIAVTSNGTPKLTTKIGATSGSTINDLFILNLAQDKLEQNLGDLADPIPVKFDEDLPNLGYANTSENLRTLNVKFKAPDNGNITYQWYEAISLNDEGKIIPGATTSSYKPVPIDGTDKYYYCVVTNTKHTKSVSSTTNRARVFVDPNIVNAIKPNVSYTLNSGLSTFKYTQYDNPKALRVNVNNSVDGKITYQWYKKDSTMGSGPSGGTPIEGAVHNIYYPETNEAPTFYEYYCLVTNTNLEANGIQSVTSVPPRNLAVQISNTAVLKNALTPNILSEPISEINYNEGENMPKLKVDASVSDGGTLSYQWYEADDEYSIGTKIPGEITSSFTPKAFQNGTKYYYCEITNTNNIATLNQVSKINSSRSKVQVSGLVTLNNDATLKSIDTTFGTLSPQFSPSNLTYELNLPHNVSSTTITGTPSFNKAKVEGNQTVTLNNDESKVISLVVKAEDNVTTKTYTITVKRPSTIKDFSINGEYYYDGTKKDVKLTVKNTKDEVLKENIDYKVEYITPNRINAGNVQFKIIGLNSYKGFETTSTFEIKRGTISKENIVLSATEFIYNNENQKPTISIKVGKTELIENVDYEVSYPSDIKNSGTKTVTITGKGNYDFTYSFTYTIKKASNTITLNIVEEKITTTSDYGDVLLKYYSDAEGLHEIEEPTAPGTYYVKGCVLESTNFEYGESDLVEFKIEDKSPEGPTDPETNPDNPEIGPDKPTDPETNPDSPEVEPDKPTEPETNPETPEVEPDKPTEPETKPDTPEVEPDKPTEPETNPDKPVEPDKPAEPETNPDGDNVKNDNSILIFSILGSLGGIVLLGTIALVIIFKKQK